VASTVASLDQCRVGAEHRELQRLTAACSEGKLHCSEDGSKKMPGRPARFLALLAAAVSFNASPCDQGARAYFIKPFNHATVKSPFEVIFGAEGVEVKAVPAGRVPENMGHHDLLINQNAIAEGLGIPKDAQHIHFDHGETRGQVTLPAGNYTLTLQFADGLERSHGTDMSATINVTVK
jgi:hypothetical protein